MDRYAVIGNPVAHSLSPLIHARFARQSGEALDYGAMTVPAGEFALHARRFFEEGGMGANVTLPFKLDAFEFAHVRSERAQEAHAANFLARRGERIEADNTDGAGLVADLTRNLGIALRGLRVLMLGAGGAARGVMAPLLREGPATVVVANRTRERAEALRGLFGALGDVRAVGLDDPGEGYDLVINATSGGTRGEAVTLPPRLFAPGVFAYDMAYGAGARAFIAQAEARGARAADGLGMLVEQAAESFMLWRGVRPDTGPVLAELRERAR